MSARPGRDAVMVNSNPETVSTDYDTSDRLYFEPLTLEDVLGVIELEHPEGVIVKFGGQTPLQLAAGLHDAGVPLLGTKLRGDRPGRVARRFGPLLDRLGLRAALATADSAQDALARAAEVGFPLLVRPVLRARRAGDGDRLRPRRPRRYLSRHARRTAGKGLLDRFLENAIEVDVDAPCDGSGAGSGA